MLLVAGGNALEGLCNLISGNIQDQLAGTFRVQNGAMLVAFVVVVVVGVVMTSNWFSRVGLEVTFKGFSGTQRFAFQAQTAPIKIP
jgi:hypothetical protein